MPKFFPARSQFAMFAVGAAIMATLLATAALAASHGHVPHFPANAAPLRAFLSPTTLARAVEACSNGLRYRHWLMSTLAKLQAGLANPRAA